MGIGGAVIHPPEQQPRVRPSRWWYALPVLLLVGGTIASILLFRAAFDRFGDVVQNSTGGTVAVGDEQLSVFGDVPRGASPPAAAGACALTPTTGGEPVLTGGSSVSLTFDRGERHWVRIGVVPEGTAQGTYQLACAGFATDDLAVGSTEGLTSGAILTAAGVLVPIVAIVSAIVAFIVVILLRSRSKNRITRQAAYASGPPPPPYDYGPPDHGAPSR